MPAAVEGVPEPRRVTATRPKGKWRAWASVGWVRDAVEVFVVAEGALVRQVVALQGRWGRGRSHVVEVRGV